MKFELYKRVKLNEDIEDIYLRKGDEVIIVDFLDGYGELRNAYLCEVLDEDGETESIEMIYENQLEEITLPE